MKRLMHQHVCTRVIMASECKVSLEELNKNQVELPFRDACAHILIPLNKCRRASYYLPWKCTHERHAYEACLHEDYLKRCEIQKERVGEN